LLRLENAKRKYKSRGGGQSGFGAAYAYHTVMDWLFVPVDQSGQQKAVQKELQYAAVKAHTSRTAHDRKRRSTTDTAFSPGAHQLQRTSIGSLQTAFAGIIDPFGCLNIRPSPILGQTIVFVRHYHEASWLPPHMAHPLDTQHRRPPENKRSLRLSISDWLWSLFLTDTGTFCAVVASVLPLLKKFTPATDLSYVDRLGLELKSNGIVRLRQDLHDVPANFIPSPRLIYHVKALFREASMSGDLVAAVNHAKMLSWLVEKVPLNTGYDSTICRVALFGDAVPALLQFRRPVCAYQNWMTPLVQAVWAAAEPVLSEMAPSPESTPEFLNPLLRGAILHCRRVLQIQMTLSCTSADCEHPHSELLFQWMMTTAESTVCKLLEWYFDATSNWSALTATSRGVRRTEPAMALALLHTYQKSFMCILREDGLDMHESAGQLLPALRTHLELLFVECTPEELARYETLHFWLLFVGSRAEERLCQLVKVIKDPAGHASGDSRRWFRRRLVSYAIEKGLQDWDAARSVLVQTVFTDSLLPDPRMWYRGLFVQQD
jgi:hypothetical protein